MDLTQLISDKESELSRLRHAAADATRKQQDESKEQMLRIIKSMEDEMQDMHREHERTLQNVIEKVQNEAAAEMERLRKEAEEAMKNFEEETIKSALYDVERHRASMQESLREQYESSLQMELERQRDQIFAECERVLQEKEDELKQSELDMKRHIETLQRQHRMELESTEHRIEALSNEVRNSVRQDSFIEAEERISKVILDAEKQCQLRDEQISLLLEERDLLQRELKDKELELKESMNDLVDLDHVFVDVAKEIKTRHQKEIMRLSEEGLVAVQQKEKLQEAIRSIESDNASLNNELVQLRLKYKAMKFKRFEQEEVNSAFGRRKNESANHIVDIHSCNQMLERQVGDLKLEKHSLTQVICELKMEIKQQAIKATNLSTTIEELRESNNTLQNDCFDMKRKCMEANERAESLQQEKRRYEQEMEHRLRQKDLQLTDALWAAGEKLNKKNEPVVVHLHGNNCDSQKSSSNDATNECNLLRSRLLEVQRENYRLEIELMEAKRECRSNVELPNINNQGDSACQKLYEENNSLKQIVTMMRKDIEHFTNSLETSNHEPGNLIASESYSFSLEQQLVQCRAYLDVLLKVRCANRGGLHVLRADDDECHFLRLRYKELHDVLDQVRAENLRQVLRKYSYVSF